MFKYYFVFLNRSLLVFLWFAEINFIIIFADIDQVPDRTDFDVFLDEVLGIPDLCGSNISPWAMNGELLTQLCCDLWQSQPNYLLCGQPNSCLDSQVNNPINKHDPFHNPSTTVPVQDEPSDPLQSQHDPPNSLFHSQPNSPFHSQPNCPYQSQTNSPSYSQPNSPMDNLSSPSDVNPAQSLFQSLSSSPYQSQSNSSPLSQSNSPVDNINSPSHVNPDQSLFQSSPCQSQSNSSLLSQPNSPVDSHLNSPSNVPTKSLFQSQSPESSSPYQSQTDSQPNSPVDSYLNSPSHSPAAQSLFQCQSSPLYSAPSSPVDSHLSNPSVSPPHSPGSLSASETSSNIYSTDEGIGSQSDMSECDDGE